MKRIILLSSFILVCLQTIQSQESIISIGYGTKISEDSSAISISFDLNRIPGRPESAGSYFLNDIFKSCTNWGYYIKPSIDINIGNGVSTAPNNIYVGTPIGLAYDFKAKNEEDDKYWGILSLYAETSPIVVSDNKLENMLVYLTFGPYLRYSYTIDDKISVDFQLGITNSIGKRIENLDSLNLYGMFSIPIYLNLKAWGAQSKKTKKKYYRIHIKNTIKNNNIYTDSPSFEEKITYWYYTGSFEFYFCPKFAINIAYKNGNDEPLFKNNHSLTFGITLAR